MMRRRRRPDDEAQASVLQDKVPSISACYQLSTKPELAVSAALIADSIRILISARLSCDLHPPFDV